MFTKRESIDYLHNKGYSRRMSAKLADIALLKKSNKTFEIAIQEALEKARTKGAKDKLKRKPHPGSIKGFLEENPADRRARNKVRNQPTNGEDEMIRRGYKKESMDEMMTWYDRHVINGKVVGAR